MALVGVALVHVALTALHGLVHLAVPVHLHRWQYWYAGAVILTAPLLGVALVGRDRGELGAALLLLSGTAALAFEGLHHFLVPNPDHVSQVAGGGSFASTAALSTAGDAVLAVAAAWFLARRAVGGRSGTGTPAD
jgi:hypothetical protein